MSPTIVDIRQNPSGTGADLRTEILNGLDAPGGSRTLPTLLLYDEQGLRLYDDITTKAHEYYLFRAEETILDHHADEIVSSIRQTGAPNHRGQEVVIELGAGALRKTSLILKALAKQLPDDDCATPVPYYALDLEERELARTLTELERTIGPSLKGKIDARGMHGTYDDGIAFIERGGLRTDNNNGYMRVPSPIEHTSRHASRAPSTTGTGSPASEGAPSSLASVSDATPPSSPGAATAEHGPLHMLFLGSSLGNFARGEDAAFLRALPLRPGAGDTLLLGLDHANEPGLIERAYNDDRGHTTAFIMNGLRVAGRSLGDERIFEEGKWEYVNRYDVEQHRHEAFYKSTVDQTIRDPTSGKEFHFSKDELVKVEVSHKFSDKDAHTLFINANLRPIQRWTDPSSRYSLWLLERPPFSFPLLSRPTATSTPFGLPTVAEWQNMWEAWDFITLRMIPPELLFQKPIDLRHICLFYLGHIPTFLDIHLSRLLQEPHTEPEMFKTIFERGIDPNVDDPTQCHDHSEVPQSDDEWPTLSSILDFRLRVRARTLRLYDDLASSKRTLTRKIARVLFMTYEHEAMHAETLLYMLLQRAGTGTLPPPEFTHPPWAALAKSASPTTTMTATAYAEFPASTVVLGHDDIEAEDEDNTDVAGHEFGWDNESPRRVVQVAPFRLEWRPVTNGQFFEFFEGAGKGKAKMPKSWERTAEGGPVQVRTIYGPVPLEVAWEWPVQTDYDGLSAYAVIKGGRLPTEAELRLFYDKFDCGYEGGANVGFRNWHPVPATTSADGGRGHNGGVWEWTSTVLDKYEGFVSSKLYPGYSADFFDGCHNVVLGGSYATIPRFAERRSVRNWYQRNYGYAWVGGRVAYDV